MTGRTQWAATQHYNSAYRVYSVDKKVFLHIIMNHDDIGTVV